MSIFTPIRQILNPVLRAVFSKTFPAKEQPDFAGLKPARRLDWVEPRQPAGDRPPAPLANPSDDSDIESDIELDIRSGRQVSLAESIGLAGRGLMAGESPVPRLMQARTAVRLLIDRHLEDSSGALNAALKAQVQTDEAHVSRWLDAPPRALVDLLDSYLTSDVLCGDLVWRVKLIWSEWSGDRPRFSPPGQPPHPDEEYTHEAVRLRLMELRSRILAETVAAPDPTAGDDTADRLAAP